MTADRARRLRLRYLIAGAAAAALWAGHAGEPAWAHALRIGLVLVTVRPLVILTRRYYARRLGPDATPARAVVILVATRVAALAAALALGTVIERLVTHQPYSVQWLTLVRVVLLLATIPLQLRFLRARSGKDAAAMLRRTRWNWLLAAKAALVVAALGVETGLDPALGKRADLVVAALILVTVATLGPRLHARLFGSGSRAPAGTSAPQPSAATPGS